MRSAFKDIGRVSKLFDLGSSSGDRPTISLGVARDGRLKCE
jgi:hypothetical protein